MRIKYIPSFISSGFVKFSVLAAAVTGWSYAANTGANSSPEISRTVNHDARIDALHERRIRFAAEHGVANPAALAASVRQSHMADLLISVAIEESRGDPVAVGLAGEKGAWQVIASHWGSVPEDIYGQAVQAERIIRALLNSAKGNNKEALAHYNGGVAPPGESYKYAERILKRATLLKVAAN
ncbi:MAG: transglycosylase SLT domain-containing protein [Desulfuromonadaceae bacterium]|nr:transglycosylase SLT domain-containing protein [Desulfuromonadaceae bacterium]